MHWICPTCGSDFGTAQERLEHRREEHYYCRECERDVEDELGPYETLLDHEVDEHNRCDECGRFFDSESNLRSVSFSSLNRLKI